MRTSNFLITYFYRQLQKAIELSEREAIKRKTQEREHAKAQEEVKAYFVKC